MAFYWMTTLLAVGCFNHSYNICGHLGLLLLLLLLLLLPFLLRREVQ